MKRIWGISLLVLAAACEKAPPGPSTADPSSAEPAAAAAKQQAPTPEEPASPGGGGDVVTKGCGLITPDDPRAAGFKGYLEGICSNLGHEYMLLGPNAGPGAVTIRVDTPETNLATISIEGDLNNYRQFPSFKEETLYGAKGYFVKPGEDQFYLAFFKGGKYFRFIGGKTDSYTFQQSEAVARKLASAFSGRIK